MFLFRGLGWCFGISTSLNPLQKKRTWTSKQSKPPGHQKTYLGKTSPKIVCPWPLPLLQSSWTWPPFAQDLFLALVPDLAPGLTYLINYILISVAGTKPMRIWYGVTHTTGWGFPWFFHGPATNLLFRPASKDIQAQGFPKHEVKHDETSFPFPKHLVFRWQFVHLRKVFLDLSNVWR